MSLNTIQVFAIRNKLHISTKTPALPDEGFNSFGWLSPIYLPPDRPGCLEIIEGGTKVEGWARFGMNH